MRHISRHRATFELPVITPSATADCKTHSAITIILHIEETALKLLQELIFPMVTFVFSTIITDPIPLERRCQISSVRRVTATKAWDCWKWRICLLFRLPLQPTQGSYNDLAHTHPLALYCRILRLSLCHSDYRKPARSIR